MLLRTIVAVLALHSMASRATRRTGATSRLWCGREADVGLRAFRWCVHGGPASSGLLGVDHRRRRHRRRALLLRCRQRVLRHAVHGADRAVPSGSIGFRRHGRGLCHQPCHRSVEPPAASPPLLLQRQPGRHRPPGCRRCGGRVLSPARRRRARNRLCARRPGRARHARAGRSPPLRRHGQPVRQSMRRRGRTLRPGEGGADADLRRAAAAAGGRERAPGGVRPAPVCRCHERHGGHRLRLCAEQLRRRRRALPGARRAARLHARRRVGGRRLLSAAPASTAGPRPIV